MTPPIRIGLAAALCVALTPAFAQLQPKQLAGPPEDMAAMRAVDPAASAILSKSALLPVVLGADGSWTTTLPAEAGRLRMLLLAGDGDWNTELVAPDGRVLRNAALVPRMQRATLGEGGETQAGRHLRLDGAQRGDWTLRLRTGSKAAPRGYVLVEGDARTELASHPVHRHFVPGERLAFTASLAAADVAGKARVGDAAGRITSAHLRIVAPDGSETIVPMHADAAASAGRQVGGFTPSGDGSHLVQVVVEGVDATGQRLLRTAEHVVPVVRSDLRLATARQATATEDGPGRVSIALPLAASDRGRHYRVLAELWSATGKVGGTPVAWVGGMVEPVDGALRVGVDTRWLARAGATGRYELRNVRVEDADHFVPLATLARLPVTMPALRLDKAAATAAIDERMTMGPRPSDLAAKATGSRLVLVHGYCSGGVWPQAQFASSSTFLDANQNRTHDQFAQRIKTFGAQWNSFGTVAHSQGGSASLHLYAYYWSGLDNATGARLLQSVGTPYQGTNLSGILATVGNWFGVACGSNSNMTYSGASAWLAGIPTSARAKVNYHTTAFRSTNWYTNDYCNVASDLVLNDPEDGTVERTYGQLPGAVNRGHTTGQCHTSGMRDPAQYLDAARNATMSANAAR